MPIIKSAKKRVRVARKAAARNTKTKRALKATLKVFRSKSSAETHRKAQSAIDTAVKKGVIHKNKAARKKRQLAALAKAAGTSKTTAKKPASSVASKKTNAPAKSASGQRIAAKKTLAAKK